MACTYKNVILYENATLGLCGELEAGVGVGVLLKDTSAGRMLLADAEVLNPDLYAAEGCVCVCVCVCVCACMHTLLAPPRQPRCRFF